jgi:hypothetical protein
MDHVAFGRLRVSRFILGGNPFSGFSHQTPQTDLAMRRFFTTARIKETLRRAEDLGIDALIARADHHVMRFLLEHWDEGGAIQWLAQSCPEYADHQASIARAAAGGARGCHIHGGITDHLWAQGRLAEVAPAVRAIRDQGLAAGIAAHNPAVLEWAEEHLDLDYYLCCYYNSAHRDQRAEHVSGRPEWFLDEDRQRMADLIRRLSRPAVHYKILAAGRNPPAAAFAYAAAALRPGDAVCVGVFPQDHPSMLEEDVALFEAALASRRTTSA